MPSEERPNPDHPAWGAICPFTRMTHATCNKGDVPEGMSPDHISWHAMRMVEIGEWAIVGGADDPDQVTFRLKEDWEIKFDKVAAQYVNLDGKEGGRLQHSRCKHVITHAYLNRENVELLVVHADNCDGE